MRDGEFKVQVSDAGTFRVKWRGGGILDRIFPMFASAREWSTRREAEQHGAMLTTKRRWEDCE